MTDKGSISDKLFSENLSNFNVFPGSGETTIQAQIEHLDSVLKNIESDNFEIVTDED